jgi:CRP-like cAMP-binding protein
MLQVEEGLLKASIGAPAGGERILAILGPGSVVAKARNEFPLREVPASA